MAADVFRKLQTFMLAGDSKQFFIINFNFFFNLFLFLLIIFKKLLPLNYYDFIIIIDRHRHHNLLFHIH